MKRKEKIESIRFGELKELNRETINKAYKEGLLRISENEVKSLKFKNVVNRPCDKSSKGKILNTIAVKKDYL